MRMVRQELCAGNWHGMLLGSQMMKGRIGNGGWLASPGRVLLLRRMWCVTFPDCPTRDAQEVKIHTKGRVQTW